MNQANSIDKVQIPESKIAISKVPKPISVYLESAKSALYDSDSLPGALRHNATRYFLLHSAWELIQIADEKLSAWANKSNIDKRLLKDHGYKLRKSPLTTYIKIVNGRPEVTKYASEDEKKNLRKLLIYGRQDTSREELFMSGWHFDNFRNSLIGRISFLEVVIKAVERE